MASDDEKTSIFYRSCNAYGQAKNKHGAFDPFIEEGMRQDILGGYQGKNIWK